MKKQILVSVIALSMTLLISCGKTGKLINTTELLEEPKIEETKIVANNSWFTIKTLYWTAGIALVLAGGYYHYYACNKSYEKGFDEGGKAMAKEDGQAIHIAVNSAANARQALQQTQQALQQAQDTIQQYAQQPSPQAQIDAAYQRGSADGQRMGLASGYQRAQGTIGNLQSLIDRMRPYMPANFFAPLQVPLQGNIPQPQAQAPVQPNNNQQHHLQSFSPQVNNPQPQPQVSMMSNHPHANVPPNVNPNAQLNAHLNVPPNGQFNPQPNNAQPRSVPFQHSRPRQSRQTRSSGRNLPPSRETEGEALQRRYNGADPSRMIVYTPPQAQAQPRVDGAEPHHAFANAPASQFVNMFTGEHMHD